MNRQYLRQYHDQINLYAREAAMNRHQVYESFHNQIDEANTQEIRCLHELAHDGCFAREAGVEFVLAVETVAEERGVSES